MMRLAGKSALITGAARGIGHHFATAYVEEGARVAIAGINGDRAQAAVDELGGQAIAIEMDVTKQESIVAIAPGVVDGEHWDGVDAFFAKFENKQPGQKKREVGANVPFGRMGRPDDLTGMAIFLASKEADYIVAQTYNVDGGQWMS